MQTWSKWRRFPDAESRGVIEGPNGPGVYEVRHIMTGSVVAFGHSANVANAISDLKLNGGVSSTAKLFRRDPPVWDISDLEYRTCSAASRVGAKGAAYNLAVNNKIERIQRSFEKARRGAGLFGLEDAK